MNFFVITIGLIIGLVFYVFFYLRRQMNQNVRFLDEEEFVNGMRKGQLIDIRKKVAYDEGHVNGARNLPLTQLTRNYNKLRSDQDIYLVCQDGKMSRRATTMLVSKGFSNVYSLKGGIESWTKPLRAKK